MEYRTLELNVISAKDLKNVNHFSKMNVYAVVSITGDPQQNQLAKSPIHRHAGNNPTWNFAVKFTVSESLARQNRLTFQIQLCSHRSLLGDKEIGKVQVPVNELLDHPGDGNSLQYMNFSIRKPSGKPKGVLSVSYKWGEKFTAAPSSVSKEKHAMAYPPPAMGSSSAPYPPPPPQHAAPYGYPAPPPYGGYPPPQPGYGYPSQPGYGYPGQPGYGYPPVQKPAKKNKLGMGMGAGLLGGALGGLIIGDMISDASAYDAGYDAGFDNGAYDAGFDDAGGFDF